MSYTITEAKANWDLLLSRVEQGQPQIIKRRTRDVAVVVSKEDWLRAVSREHISRVTHAKIIRGLRYTGYAFAPPVAKDITRAPHAQKECSIEVDEMIELTAFRY